MSESNGTGKGVQAYRWMVTVGMAATVSLAGMILKTVSETASDVTALKIQITTLTANQLHQSSRIDSIERRNDLQDNSIIDLQRRVWRLPALESHPR
jgi:hypothetical protein